MVFEGVFRLSALWRFVPWSYGSSDWQRSTNFDIVVGACEVRSLCICLSESWVVVQPFSPPYSLEQQSIFQAFRLWMETSRTPRQQCFPSFDGVSKVQRWHRALLTARRQRVQEEDGINFPKDLCVAFSLCKDWSALIYGFWPFRKIKYSKHDVNVLVETTHIYLSQRNTFK